jgi:hypothetical protein
MKETLKLEHLAPYLPFGLNVLFEYKPSFKCDPNYFKTEELHPSNILIVGEKTYSVASSKPILRPLSDLTKEIEVNGEKFMPKEFIEEKYYTQNWANELERCIEDKRWIFHLDYSCILYLFEWHFDVFGLIEKNLAIDINTLTK